jgi:hypothetical protein
VLLLSNLGSAPVAEGDSAALRGQTSTLEPRDGAVTEATPICTFLQRAVGAPKKRKCTTISIGLLGLSSRESVPASSDEMSPSSTERQSTASSACWMLVNDSA